MNINEYGVMIDFRDTLYLSGSWAFITGAVIVYALYRLVKKYYI